MACRFLICGLLVVLALAPAALAAPLACEGVHADGVGPADVEQLPLYLLLVQRLGAARQCIITHGDAGDLVTVQFPSGGVFTLNSNSVLVSAEQQARFSSAAAPGRADAVVVLKAAEWGAAGAAGCGIGWSALRSMPADGERVVEGKSCSCKARLSARHGVITSMGFSTAC